MTTLTALELAIAAVACAPAIRLLANRSTRQVASGLFLGLASSIAAFAGGMLYLGIRHPAWLHLPALITAVVAIAAWWRARVNAGASRRLPPGSMSLFRSIEAIVDRHFYRDRFERHGPVFKMAQFHHRTICVLGLDLGHRLLREQADSLGPTALDFNREIDGGFLRYMDAVTHQKYGSLFRAAFSPAVVGAATPAISATLHREIESCLGEQAATLLSAEDLRSFSRRLAYRAMLRLVFDLEPGTKQSERYDKAHSVFGAQASDRALTDATRNALEQLRQVVREQCDHLRWRIRAGESPSTCALEEILRLDADQPDVTTVDNLIFVTKIASGNVGSYLAWQLVMLGRNPEWLVRLRDELASRVETGNQGLTRRIVKETLRLRQSEYLYRKVTRDFTAAGFLFPRGWQLRICVRESHRRGDLFENPELFDPDRFARHEFSSSEYSPFGFLRHACLGVPTTHMIGERVIEHLVGSFDWTVRRDGLPEREFRHWKHWRPSHATILEFAPLAGQPAPSKPI